MKSPWAALEPSLSRGALKLSPADLDAYSYDAAPIRSRPDAVVLAGREEDAAEAVRFCVQRGLPYTARGAGTNLSGGAVPLSGGAVVSLARMNRVLAVDTAARQALVEPGAVNAVLQKELEKENYFYAPDPASWKVSTLGGNIAENAGGPRCLKYGVTTNHVLALEAVMPDGSLGTFSSADPGPDIMSLLVGSEGTLGLVTKARLKIAPAPRAVATFLAGFSSVESAMDCVSAVIAAGVIPRAMEAMDDVLVKLIEARSPCGYPGTPAVLLIELDGEAGQVDDEATRVGALCRAQGALDLRAARDARERDRLWEGRRGAYAAMARLAPNVLVEDGAVPRPKLSEVVRRIRQVAARRGLKTPLLFHAGDGNIHPHLTYDERDAAAARLAHETGQEMLQACIDLGGSISGEHGIGCDKRAAMARLFGRAELECFRRMKKALDPGLLANPDKVIPLPAEEAAAGPGRPPRPLSPYAAHLAEKIKAGAAQGRRFAIAGSGSKWRNPAPADLISLETPGLNAILDLDAGNMTLTVEAGISLEVLHWELEKRGLFLGLPKAPGTLGGFLAAKAWPDARQELLGMRLLLAGGDAADFGGKVVKNVAGYDIPRLMMGSWGAFGLIVDATLRLYARPQGKAAAAGAPELFKPNAWHRKLKSAFDAENRFNPWIFAP